MKLAFSSNAFRRYSISDTIAILSDAGYEGIELMADRPHAWPEDLDEGKVADIRASLDQYGMSVSNVNAFMMCAWRHPQTGKEGTFHWPSWIDPEEDVREARIRHTEACVDLTAAVGAKTLSTEPGGPLAGGDRDAADRLFAAGLRRVAERAVRAGVTLLIEPEPDLLLETSAQYRDFMERHVDFPGVGLNLDLGHFYCVGEDPAEVVRQPAMAPDHVHLEDISSERVHHHLLPGEGAMDFEAIFAALRERAYDGWVTVELYPYQDDPVGIARQAHERIRPFLK